MPDNDGAESSFRGETSQQRQKRHVPAIAGGTPSAEPSRPWPFRTRRLR
jgi:hypothetical protein